MTDHVLEGRGYYRCKKCRVEHVTEARRNNKKKLLAAFNFRCGICGYDKYPGALTFHHLDPNKKEFSISQAGTCKSLEKLLEEANKCVMLCVRCHAEVHGGVTEVPEHLFPGSGWSQQDG